MLKGRRNANAYWVFPIENVHQKNFRRIAVALNRSESNTLDKIKVKDEFVQSLNSVVNAALDFYYVKPSANDNTLSPMAKKAADSVVNTVRKAIHLVIQRVFKKMSLKDLTTMACYMDSMGITNLQEGGLSYIAFPLNNALQDQLSVVMSRINSESEIECYSTDLIGLFSNIVKEGARYYYHKPTEMVDVGGFTKKAADLGIDTTVKGIQGLIRRVVKDISHKDIELLPDNIGQLVVNFNVPHEVCSAVFIEDKTV